jgi:hypothetical protein
MKGNLLREVTLSFQTQYATPPAFSLRSAPEECVPSAIM